MSDDPPLGNVLEMERRAWRDLPPADYERAVCGMLDELAGAQAATGATLLLLDLVEVMLERDDPILADSRACAGGHLLSLLASRAEPEERADIRRLFLSAWQQLCSAAEAGPESVPMTPELPPGVELPYGADPAAIGDPKLRAQAERAAAMHAAAIDRWNARQRAHSHIQHLGEAVRRMAGAPAEEGRSAGDLMTAMSRAKGLPSSPRQSSEE